MASYYANVISFCPDAILARHTRSRVNFFMNKFKKLGFIEYNAVLKVNHSMLTVIVHE